MTRRYARRTALRIDGIVVSGPTSPSVQRWPDRVGPPALRRPSLRISPATLWTAYDGARGNRTVVVVSALPHISHPTVLVIAIVLQSAAPRVPDGAQGPLRQMSRGATETADPAVPARSR